MRLIRLLVATLALALAVGIGTGSAAAKDVNHARKASQLAKQAKRTSKKASRLARKARKTKKQCRKKHGTAKGKCLRSSKRMTKQSRRLRAKARRLNRQAAKHRRLARQIRNNPPATVRTTEYGIPRILADNWRGLGFGYGYSLAKQNICSMAQIYTTVRGERSRYFGPTATWMLTGNGIPYTNLQSDFAHKRVIAEGTIDRILRMDPPNGPVRAAREAVDGYVNGYNRYLRQTGVNNIPDATCKGKPWVKPITKQDVYLRFFELGTMAGLGVAVDGTADAAPPASGASVDSGDGATITPEDIEQMKSHDPDIGSNAVGLGSDTTSTGKGMLYGNPHFPWQGSERFFEAQLTIPGKINVSGASLLGVPLILIGHTQNMAWSHTVSTARRFSLYQEKLVPGKPTWYYVDGRQTPMKKTKVTVQVKQPGGAIEPETRTLYSTVHGPITTTLQKNSAFTWSTQNAYSIFDANANGLRFINFFFRANRAQSVNQLVKALKDTLGVPWVNTIAADSEGNALYADVGSVPNIDDARAAECNTGMGNLLWPTMQVAVFDGSVSDCDMRRAPGTPAKGLLPASRMPVQIRSDYTSNMNDSYWLSNPNAPLTGFPWIIGNEGTARSLRTRNGLNQIEQRLNGNDPNGTDDGLGDKFTPDLLRQFIDNDWHYGGYLLIPDLAADCQANPGNYTGAPAGDVTTACNVLANWDHTEKLDSAGAYLARRVIGRILTATGGIYTVPFDVNDPVHTPRGLNVANPNVRKALTDSINELNGLSIPLNATIRDYQFVDKDGDIIPIPGGSGGQGMFNVISSGWDPSTGNYDSIVHGSSFIQMASLDGTKCPDVKTILTYSQAATDVNSPHYKDQTELFSNSEWVTDRFCASQQKASPDLEVKNLNGGAEAVKKGW